jgi:hypothetical protein
VLGKGGRHEGSGLLAPRSDIRDPILASAQCLNDRSDPIADYSEHMRCTLCDQGFDQNVRRVRIIGKIGFIRCAPNRSESPLVRMVSPLALRI